ncbi:MotA/TolQ/ExbB proton channel family protein [Alteromonas pelagimontana]|uniref:MotA/TolQ/ExbB proton channel family protein n=1 Tax=Alteromonas pelagimontana TaxID=1858656 RepID=A0A6M4MDU7_9ALTE|nr:MotA/TolQ/ExbB proton channel family protein [Alteromonas pelagimontana]QJR80790.1 MotA/TolQ/ExbB proton channel family protein [Alteromonas pelagimontana]
MRTSLPAVFLLLFNLLPMAQATTVEQYVLTNIEKAKHSLTSTESRIVRERVKLADELRALEQKVIALRNDTAVARRLVDERTLSLTQMEDRLASWKEQQNFQQNLLDRFLQQNGLNYGELQSLTLAEKMQKATTIAATLGQAQRPQWQQKQVVLGNGEIAEAATLSLGPVTWFYQQDKQLAGLAEQQKDMLRASGILEGDLGEPVIALRQQPQGSVVFDPTMGRAMTREQASETVVEHVIKGGVWVVPILLFALIATVIGIVKVLQLWRLPAVVPVSSARALAPLLNGTGKAAQHIKGMQRQLLDIARNALNARERDDHLFVQLQQNKQKLEKWLNAIAVTAAVAPLLGLLGTVSGMIETFRMMTSFGSSDPEVISGGIAKALVTTELGLVVAIPALILNALLSRKARQYYTDLESFALLLSGDDVPEASSHVQDNQQNQREEDSLLGMAPQPAGA